ncbi:hypothetical protein JG688_00017967 [Phytophthora aleatoria]|uniref:Uncharacterized protein n=1 Tax=Phytophthora aleatoria TaxID=2496075 RepID=A0A8J5LY78_9STRA|nr:hypothetical protein JG688_00017967 [Phytophthora aleatoria]
MSFVLLYVRVIHKGLCTTRGNFYRQPPSMNLPTFAAGFMAAVTIVKLEAWIKATGFKFHMLHIIAIRVVFRRFFVNWLGMPLPPAGYIMPYTSAKSSLLIVIEMIQPSTVSQIFEWVVLRYMLHAFVIFTHPVTDATTPNVCGVRCGDFIGDGKSIRPTTGAVTPKLLYRCIMKALASGLL